MLLPNAKNASVDRNKITGYLLNDAHPDGAGKAEFFKVRTVWIVERNGTAPRLITAHPA